MSASSAWRPQRSSLLKATRFAGLRRRQAADNLPLGVEFIDNREQFLRGAKMLLSITGTRAITVADYELLPHRALVMNGASSNDELSAVEAIQTALYDQPPRAWWSPKWQNDKRAYIDNMPALMSSREYVLPATGWLWGEIDDGIIPLGSARLAATSAIAWLHFGDKGIYLAKNGFVLNLTDHPDPIPAHIIQSTRAGIAACCAQAVKCIDVRKHMQLDPDKSKALHESYRAHGRRSVGAALDDPSLPLIAPA